MKIANPTDDIVKILADTAVIHAVPTDEYEVMDTLEIHRRLFTLVHDCNTEYGLVNFILTETETYTMQYE